MHYIKGCPCLFKAAWIEDHTLKNIFVIQKCIACGYTKEQCGYVFEELKSMGLAESKPEAAYISDLYQTYGELPFSCKEVDTNYHFEAECEEINFAEYVNFPQISAIISLVQNCRCCATCSIIRPFR